MYERFYKLRERPFALTPDPDYVYPSRIHAQALTRLRNGLANGTSLIVLTGEIGSGKTTLLHTALRGLQEGTSISWIVNTQLDACELVEAIVLGFGLEPRPDSTEERLTELLARFLADEEEAGRRTLLVIDEAQNLGLPALDRMLTALEQAQAPRLRVVLVGQPSLGDLLRTKELQRLRRRIGVRYHLRGLDASETAAYINHRLRHASLGDALEFPEAVCGLIHLHSRGVPRRINVLSDTVLLHAYGEGKGKIDPEIARTALGELERSGATPSLREARRAESARPRESVVAADADDLPLLGYVDHVPEARPASPELQDEIAAALDLSLAREPWLRLRTPEPPVDRFDFDLDLPVRPRRRLRPVAAIATVVVTAIVGTTLGLRTGAGEAGKAGMAGETGLAGGATGLAGAGGPLGDAGRVDSAGTVDMAGTAGAAEVSATADGAGTAGGAAAAPVAPVDDVRLASAVGPSRSDTLDTEISVSRQQQLRPPTTTQPSAVPASSSRETLRSPTTPIPPLNQRPAANPPLSAPPASPPPAAPSPVETTEPRPLILPPVAEASTQALAVVPESRSGPPLAVPPRVPTAEMPPGVSLPPPMAAPATSSAPAARTAAATAPRDEESVRSVVDQYRAAFSALDASAAKAVWPSVDTRVLGRAFGQLASQEFQFDGCRITVNGVLATAACGGRARFVPKVGDRTPRLEARTWTFDLQKSFNGGWTIQRVQAR